MSWTRPADIRLQLQKSWDKGELLASICSEEPLFPKRISLKQPTSAEISEAFDSVRSWAAEIAAMPNCRLEQREFNHRVFGKNSLPTAVWFDTLEDALAIIGQRRALTQFKRLLSITMDQQPALRSWLRKRPRQALALHDDFEKLLAVVTWLQAHPRPNIFQRQVDLAGIDSKFIETNRGVLSEWLDVCLPPEYIDTSATPSQFAQRYGFKEKLPRIRFRLLDKSKRLLNADSAEDLTLDADSFATLRPAVSQVFITENEINYLAFPDLPDSLIIFGSGYGFEVLDKADWLLHCHIHYWGDIDTHGFAILNSLRERFPHTLSLMMDERTLLHHRELWGFEDKQSSSFDLGSLSEDELAIYARLKNHFWQNNLRLEQERIQWRWAELAIRQAWTACVEFAHDASKQNDPDTRHTSISDRDLIDYLHPSICEKRTFLEAHQPASRLDTEFEATLKRLSQRHTEQHLLSLPSLMRLEQYCAEDRVARTQNAMNESAPAIYKPLLSVTRRLGGRELTITAHPDLLILDDDTGEYIIRKVEQVRSTDNPEDAHTVLSLQLAAWIYTEIQGRTPARIEVCNSENELVPIENDSGRTALRHLIRILQSSRRATQPYSPVEQTKCEDCRFAGQCLAEAESRQDVALLSGVDQQIARTLHAMGVQTANSLVAEFDESRLSKIPRVGKRAKHILAQAQAVIENHTIVSAKPERRNSAGPD